MRLSSTPPNNFSKASVNQPSSLQQRQGMEIPAEVERNLATIYNSAQAPVRGMAESFLTQESTKQLGESLNCLMALGHNKYYTLLKGLESHIDPFTLTIDSKDGLYILNILDEKKQSIRQAYLTDRMLPDIMNPLEQLLEALPRLAEEHAAKG
jgi:hypothetical protein